MVSYSAPGKALLAGGYLVLFPEYEAFSVALSNRIHAEPEASEDETLVVSSPQFEEAVWEFPPTNIKNKNPFLESCFETVSAYYGNPVRGKVTIWSDDGFHSQSESVSGPNAKFRYHKKPITEVPKTGLGSSAALVAAVVAAMSKLSSTANGSPELSQYQLHNLAQIAHCHAQGKVGSGFDVATAIYGSITYSRFLPGEIPASLNSSEIQTAVNKQWKMVAEPCKLPPNVIVVMGDVAQGSQTPGMVKGVLEWHKNNAEEGQQVFGDINRANIKLSSALQQIPTSTSAISNAIKHVREEVRKLTALSNVPIEPPSQTKLLDAASQIDGVLGGVVPGAGGNDAVSLLVNTADQPLESTLEKLASIEGVQWIPMGLETKGLIATQ